MNRTHPWSIALLQSKRNVFDIDIEAYDGKGQAYRFMADNSISDILTTLIYNLKQIIIIIVLTAAMALCYYAHFVCGRLGFESLVGSYQGLGKIT